MLHTVIFDDEIKLWWDYVPLSKGESFSVRIDGEERFTEQSHFNFKGLTPDTEYLFNVCVKDGAGNLLSQIGELSARTTRKKNRIDVTKPPYNAVGDGVTLNTGAIQAAINDCGEEDCVYIPDGTFLSGALDLKSDMELYLADNAVLLGSQEACDYLPKIESRFEGWEMMCYRSFLNVGKMDNSKGCNAQNILIRGGKILGGGNELRKAIIAVEREIILKHCGMQNEASPHALYSSVIPGRARGRTLCCCNTKNVVVANTVIGNSPAWNLHFIYCEDITVCGCSILSKKISNGDGVDPDSTRNCTIFDVEFDTGDDSVAIKSGKNPEGYYIARPSENINVFDCKVTCGHGIAIGSEMSGGVSNVNIWNVKQSLGYGIVIKTRAQRGGYVRDVNVFHCEVPTIQVGEYGCVDDGGAAPEVATVSNLVIRDVTLTGQKVFITNLERREAVAAISIRGLGEGNPVKDVLIKNVTFKNRTMVPYQTISLSNVENVEIENATCEGEV